jgi:dTDP-4-dehydrorhamnose reductase
MKNIAIIGPTGMLGWTLEKYFSIRNYDVLSLGMDKFNIIDTKLEILLNYLGKVDAVINCAGLIREGITNNSYTDVLKINSIFPKNLAVISEKLKIKCIQISTDCVFSGSRGNYTENDYSDAVDLYGVSKYLGESHNCMFIRTSIIGQEIEPKGSLLSWAISQKGREINGFTNHIWNGVTTLYYAEIVENILNHNYYQNGIIHVHSPNSVTKYDLLSLINKIHELNITINPIESPNYCNRSLSSIYPLSGELVKKEIEQQIYDMKKFFDGI